MSNLRLINDTTITSGVSTVNIEKVFSADFDIYKIVANGISTVGTTQTDPDLRFINSGGSVVSSSDYQYAHQIMRADASFTEQNSTGDTELYRFFGESVDQEPEDGSQVSYIFNPFTSSSYTFALYQSMVASAGLKIAMKGIGILTQTASMTGFQVKDNNGSRPFAGGQVKTYGLRVDS